MKKAIEIVKQIFTIVIVLISVGMMIFTIVSVNTFNRTDRNLFGFRAFIVLTDSMSATDFSAGDLIFTKQVDPTTLREGDIIAFTSQSRENYGEIITHKIREAVRDANGDSAFVTYGTTTGVNDETLVTYPYILGRYTFSLPKVGLFFNFLKTVPGYICCILVPFLILLVMQLVNFIRVFREYKEEQMEQLRAERERLEEERRQSAEMMNELLSLKAQLAAQQTAAPKPEEPKEEPKEESKEEPKE